MNSQKVSTAVAADELPTLPELREMDDARWGYNSDDMRSYAEEAVRAALAQRQQDGVSAAGPVKWTDDAIMSLLHSNSDGPFGTDDIEDTRRFMELSEVIRAELTEESTSQRQQPQAVQPLTVERVKELMREAGYDQANMQAKADFITGIRHAEKAHGIGTTGGENRAGSDVPVQKTGEQP